MQDTKSLANHTQYEQFVPQVDLFSQRKEGFKETVQKLIGEYNQHITLVVDSLKQTKLSSSIST